MAKKYETPKGTRDYLPADMRTRRYVFDKLRACFERFGFEELDTPAFEYLEVLTLKSGAQAEHEIYSFTDKGERRLGLRFDLTSSTGRVVASHPELPRPFYRYQIGKVWRYDRPQAGRYREFYQADCDILGSASLDCEVTLLLMATEVLAEFGLDEYKLVLNNRKILDAQIRTAGIPQEKKADVLRALDKLAKIGVEGVKLEFEAASLNYEHVVKLLDMIVVTTLDEAAATIAGDEVGEQGVRELREIFDSAERLGFADHLVFDWSLVRGLDYYTGPIFEAQAKTESGFGSFGGGGRYDDLVGLYGGQPQGAVGLSFGAERLIGLLEERGLGKDGATRAILIAALDGQIEAAHRLARTLRKVGIASRVVEGLKDRGAVFKYSDKTGLDRVILIGKPEAESGVFGLRQAGGSEQRGTAEELARVLA